MDFIAASLVLKSTISAETKAAIFPDIVLSTGLVGLEPPLSLALN
jgi:hypothetical protein